jgi:tRNA-dihydrouridine synthase A
MIHANAILHGNQKKFLDYHKCENPITLQLGGNDPKNLSICSKLAEELGYNEVNLNVGCPSDRVQSGAFGLCMMKTPDLVAECIHEMKKSTNIPISVKCRIGYDNHDSHEELHHFINTLLKVNTDFICIHARKGWLKGLSPKENRTIPKINYDTVYQIKSDFPEANIGINGEIKTLEEAKKHLKHVDSTMIGRAAYHNPYMLIEADQVIYHDRNKIIKSRFDIIEELFPYIETELTKGAQLNHITRHILGLFQGVDGARQFRRYLSENSSKKGANIKTLQNALSYIKL